MLKRHENILFSYLFILRDSILWCNGAVQNGPPVIGAIGPIRDTIKSTVAATGIDKRKKKIKKKFPYLYAGHGSVKIGELSL